jgi:hypothetical protein
MLTDTKSKKIQRALQRLKGIYETKTGGSRYSDRIEYKYAEVAYQEKDQGEGLDVPLLQRGNGHIIDVMDEEDEKAEREARADAAANIPRSVGPDGNEEISEKVLQSVTYPGVEDGDFKQTDEEMKRNNQWTLQCDYEQLPFAPIPFLTFKLSTGKDDIHKGFLDRLLGRGKQEVGVVRGSFTWEEIIEDGKARSQPASISDFNSREYKDPASGYTVRVYVMYGLQLVAKGGSARYCDTTCKVSIGKRVVESPIVRGSINPDFFMRTEFKAVVLPAVDSVLEVEIVNKAGRFTPNTSIGSTSILLENRVFSRYWSSKEYKPVERRALRLPKINMPQGHVEMCVDICRDEDAGSEPMAYLMVKPVKTDWELRCIVWTTRDVTPKKIYQSEDDCCCIRYCAPPNQSDIQIRCGLPKQNMSKTDTHERAIDGEAMFHWRSNHRLTLPCPEPLANFKVQVWNINWKPDDCIAEAVIPLWKFFEKARRQTKGKLDKKDRLSYKTCAFQIPKQEVFMQHPYNPEDKGYVMMELELLPVKLIEKDRKCRAAEGPAGWETSDVNSKDNTLEKCVRPDSSFPWYRLDKQIAWRVKFFCKKTWGWWLLALIICLVGVGVYIWYYTSMLNAVTN